MRWHEKLLSVSICACLFSCGSSKSKFDDRTQPQTQVTQATVGAAGIPCPIDFVDRCADIQKQIDAANLSLTAATTASDATQTYLAQMQLNELMETLEAYKKGNANITPIHQRYEALRQIIEANNGVPGVGSKVIYQSAELAATREVMTDFGELKIDPKQIQETGAAHLPLTVYKVNDGVLPWSAYWYPKRSKELFDGDSSPLAKLDAYLKKNRVTSDTDGWEADHFDSKAAEWEGLCDAWAFAGTMTTEPKAAMTFNGINFSVSDLKALAIKYFEGYKPKIYGRRYLGTADTDGQIQDLRPEAFHRIVQQVIGVQQKAIIIDEDPGPEVWSKPLFRMSFRFTRDPDIANAILVDAYPWMVRQRPQVSDDLTTIQKDLAAPVYQYRLYLDPKPEADGSLKVVAGEWINGSINAHPDMVFLPVDTDNKNQLNLEIRNVHDEVRKLLVKAGMMKDAG
ncbi:MAG: hypothetical protein H7249_01890 [Chitinophagaceae bacterium]|nr:hypothetical protein [Oligoflexus sp.]